MLSNHIVAERSGTDNAFSLTFLKNVYRLEQQFLSTNQTQHDCGLVKIYDLSLKSTKGELYPRELLEGLPDHVIQPGITPGQLLTGIHLYH